MPIPAAFLLRAATTHKGQCVAPGLTLGLPGPQTMASYVAAEPVRWMLFTVGWLTRKAPCSAPPYTISRKPASTRGAKARLQEMDAGLMWERSTALCTPFRPA